MCTQRGLSGARTCVSIPSDGRCVANLSGRCTPPPPAGGKYSVTSRTFVTTTWSRKAVERKARVPVYRAQGDRRVRLRTRDDEPARVVAPRDREVAAAVEGEDILAPLVR